MLLSVIYKKYLQQIISMAKLPVRVGYINEKFPTIAKLGNG